MFVCGSRSLWEAHAFEFLFLPLLYSVSECGQCLMSRLSLAPLVCATLHISDDNATCFAAPCGLWVGNDIHMWLSISVGGSCFHLSSCVLYTIRAWKVCSLSWFVMCLICATAHVRDQCMKSMANAILTSCWRLLLATSSCIRTSAATCIHHSDDAQQSKSDQPSHA